jgi:hypothetical protein
MMEQKRKEIKEKGI